jgi:cardiolipin synthase
LALGIFFLAGISDLLDGFLARKFSWQSKFGQIADPVADKTLVVATIISLGSIDLIENWFMFMVLGRDLLIIVGVVLANYLISDYQVAPNNLGKLNTTILLLLVGIILIDAVGFLVTDIAIYWTSILFIFTNTISLIVYFIDPGIKILRNIK